MLEISELFLHPIKSCRGISVQHCLLTHTGFAFDRQFVVVHAGSKEGKFITGRTHPALALVTPSLPPSLLDPSKASFQEELMMTIKAPGMADLTLDISSLVKSSSHLMSNLDPASQQELSKTELAPVTVWEWKGLGEDQGDAASNWFSTYLQVPCRLIRYLGSRGNDSAPSDQQKEQEQVLASKTVRLEGTSGTSPPILSLWYPQLN